MCKTSTSTSSSSIPKWLESETKGAIGFAKGIQPYQPYNKPRVAGFGGDTQQGFGALRDFFGQANSNDATGTALSLAGEAGAAPAANLQTERVVDEGGRLGAMKDYMNPYVQGALSPTLRNIMDAAGQERKRIGAGATSAGAFGDARHGVVEGQLGQNTANAVSDASYRAYSDAFGNAMGARGADLNRFGSTDLANAQLGESALQRKLAAGQAMPGIEAQGQSNFMERLSAMLGMGNAQDAKAQSLLDVDYTEAQKQRSDIFERLSALVSAISGIPHNATQTNSQPDNSGLNMLGTIIGSAI